MDDTGRKFVNSWIIVTTNLLTGRRCLSCHTRTDGLNSICEVKFLKLSASSRSEELNGKRGTAIRFKRWSMDWNKLRLAALANLNNGGKVGFFSSFDHLVDQAALLSVL